MSERTPQSPDEQLVRREIGDAALEQREISPTVARVIASWFHGGQASAFYSFVSTGAIDRERLTDEYVMTYQETEELSFDRLALDVLGTYWLHADGVDENGNRGPVAGWHEATKWGEQS